MILSHRIDTAKQLLSETTEPVIVAAVARRRCGLVHTGAKALPVASVASVASVVLAVSASSDHPLASSA